MKWIIIKDFQVQYGNTVNIGVWLAGNVGTVQDFLDSFPFQADQIKTIETKNLSKINPIIIPWDIKTLTHYAGSLGIYAYRTS